MGDSVADSVDSELGAAEAPASSGGIYIGIALVVLGQFIGSSSMLLMKRASVDEADRPFYRRPTFQFAFALFLFNTIVLDAVIYALTPLTIVAPLTALGVVFVNICVAVGFLVEKEPRARILLRYTCTLRLRAPLVAVHLHAAPANGRINKAEDRERDIHIRKNEFLAKLSFLLFFACFRLSSACEIACCRTKFECSSLESRFKWRRPTSEMLGVDDALRNPSLCAQNVSNSYLRIRRSSLRIRRFRWRARWEGN